MQEFDFKEAHNRLVQLLPQRLSGLEFVEETHTYLFQGKQLKSVTTLLSEKGISPDYTSVDKELLKRSSDYGKMIHKEIEEWVKFGKGGISDELLKFIQYLEENNLIVVASELMVHNDTLAGTIDLLLFSNKTHELIIADIKTTSVVHTYSVQWQLSLYDHIGEIGSERAMCFHFDKECNLEVKEVGFIRKDLVVNLVENNNLPALLIDETQIALVEKAVMSVEALEQEIAVKKAFIDDFNAKLIIAMEEQGVKSFENDKIKITYVAPVTRKGIDTTRLKKEHPEIAEEYQKETTTKASVRITLKKPEKVEEESEEEE